MVQADLAKLLEAATAVEEAHMKAEKAKKPRLKTNKKQNKTLFVSLAPLKSRFLLMPWLLCKSLWFAKLITWHMPYTFCLFLWLSGVTCRAVGWLSLCADKSCCVLGVLCKGVLASAVSFVGVAARKVWVSSHKLQIIAIGSQDYSETWLEMIMAWLNSSWSQGCSCWLQWE